jgi:pyrroloquinoline quinone biosynthesis protein B
VYFPGALDFDEWFDESSFKINKMKAGLSKINILKSSILIVFLLKLSTPVFAQETKILQTGKNPLLVILGTLQDGGSPHLGCQKDCCKEKDFTKKVVSLGLIDQTENKTFLFEATPDIVDQIKMLNDISGKRASTSIDGIFLTHAHIGHYSGLMYLGREAWNTRSIPVFVMPKMKNFLEKNGPWSQLVSINNIGLIEIENKKSVPISKRISITPYLIPHRDEYSETVGYKISGLDKTALFIPDIDKWSKWELDITKMISEVDYAFIDGTFFSTSELNNRNIEEIPHPLITESIKLFDTLDKEQKNKIWFIHLNHSNPALNKNSSEHKMIIEKGFHIASIGDLFTL